MGYRPILSVIHKVTIGTMLKNNATCKHFFSRSIDHEGHSIPPPSESIHCNGVFTLPQTRPRQIVRPIKMAYIELYEGVHTALRSYQ